MSQGATTSKTCIACGTDCAGKPRTKDAQGRYLCKPCFEARAKAAKPASAPKAVAAATIPLEDDGVLASLLESEPAAAPVVGTPCPSCGASLSPGAVICTTCGHDLRTGKGTRATVQKQRGEGAEKALAVAGAVAGVPMTLLIGCVCAGVGGGLGAGLWAFIAYQADREYGIIAWLVGVLAGIGMMVGARKHAGFLTGGLAAGIAVLSIAGGKYLAVSTVVDKHLGSVSSARAMLQDDMMIGMLARATAEEWEGAGKKVDWPGGSEPDNPTEKSEFPQALWNEASSRWQKLGPDKQREMKTEAAQFLKEAVDDDRALAKEEIFKASFRAIDILWFVLAVASAFRIGSGLSSDD